MLRLFDAGHLRQRLRFGSLPDLALEQAPFTVRATASSGLPVSFRASGTCSVTGARVSLTAPGLCTVTASQPGDRNYEPAPEASQSVQVLSDLEGFRRPVADPPALSRGNNGRAVTVAVDIARDPGRDALAARGWATGPLRHDRADERP